MTNAIKAAIEAVAEIRNSTVEEIINEIREGNESTKEEVFLMTCAAGAIQ